jgi:hypothetical protein
VVSAAQPFRPAAQQFHCSNQSDRHCDRVRALAPQHPEWATEEPFHSVIAHDMAGVAAAGEHGIAKIVAVTHTGMSPEAFRQIAGDWFVTARHPRFARP